MSTETTGTTAAADIPANIPDISPYFRNCYITTDTENRITSLFSLPKGEEPPEGAIFLREGMTQPKLFPDGKENPTLAENGVYKYKWTGTAPEERSEEEKAADAEALRLEKLPGVVRDKRDRLLAESDFSQLPDVPLTGEQKDAWAAYRRELRDITKQPGFPAEVVWPVKPE
jgi:hypothetical protein